MVSIQEARQIVDRNRQQLRQQQQQVDQARRDIEKTRLRELSRQELQVRSLQEKLEREKQAQRLEGLKSGELRKLSPVQKDLEEARKKIDVFDKEVKVAEVAQEKQRVIKKAFDKALNVVISKDPRAIFSLTTKEEKKIFKQLQAGKEASIREAIEKAKEDLVKQGVKLEDIKEVTKKGELFPTKLEITPALSKVVVPTPKQIGLIPSVNVTKVPIPRFEKIKENIQAVKRVFNIPELSLVPGIKRLAEETVDVITVSDSAIREKKVVSVNLPSTIKGTQITRPVDFTDIDTGRLPNLQNLELKSTRILTDFNTGRLSEQKALDALEKAHKKFVLDESKRTAGLRFVEGVGVGALTAIVPPLGWTVIGLTGADALFKRREILEFAKRNPKAAALQFSAGILGGFVGAGGIKSLAIKKAIIQEPTIKLVGKSRIKLINQILENLEKDLKIKLEVPIKTTATRAFEIKIPSPKNNVILRILEFSKDGIRNFAGVELIKGKVKTTLKGITLGKGKTGASDLITRVIRKNTKGGLTSLEISQYLERAKSLGSRNIQNRVVSLIESETKLAKQFGLKKLNPGQVREILRRPLFGIKEAQKRISQPFTDAEFKLASKVGKSQMAISEKLVRVRVTKLTDQIRSLISERNFLDVRVIEVGKGRINLEFALPKSIKAFVKVNGKKKIADVIDTSRISIKKAKLPERTLLSKTFSQQTQQILRSKEPKNVKLQKLRKLQKRISPTGTFRAIAKTIQKERIKLATKQAAGVSAITSLGTGVSLVPRSKTIQKIKQLSKTKPLVGLKLVTKPLIAQAEVLALGGKITQTQLQALKQKLVLKQTKVIKKKELIALRKPRVPRVPLPKGVESTDLIRAIQKLGKKNAVNIIVGMKTKRRKVIGRGLPPFKALKKSEKFVDKNIEASFILKPTGKKSKQKDIKPFNLSPKFRRSKVNPLFQVEKRKSRLDTPTEVRQLKLFKGKVPRGIFPKIKRRRKK